MDDNRSPLTRSVADRQLLAAWAGACAARVLPLFEARHPDDGRPRRAVEAAQAWAHGEIRVGQARQAAFAAHAAARVASDPAARAAARSCGQAAGTVHMGGHARHAADYAATAVGHASADGSDAVALERAWQYEHLPGSLRSFVYPSSGLA